MRSNFLAIVLISFVLTGCHDTSDDDNVSVINDDTGKMDVAVTDAPVDGAVSVVVEFTAVELKRAGQGSVLFNLNSPRQIDLLALHGGAVELLLDGEVVEAGDYEWIRLHVNAERSVIDSFIELDDGSQHSLFIPSGSQEGLRLVSTFNVDETGTSRFTIDFDLRKSVHAPPGLAGDYLLRPVLRLVEDELTGGLSGTVDANLIDANCSPAVYVFEGSGTTPDDVDGDDGDPLTSGLVELNNSTGQFEYNIGFLNPGDYTAAFTCEADLDEPDADDVIVFPVSRDVSIEAGVITQADFS